MFGLGMSANDEDEFPARGGKVFHGLRQRPAPHLFVQLGELARHGDGAISQGFLEVLEGGDQSMWGFQENECVGKSSHGLERLPALRGRARQVAEVEE
jgi:hypothetical protein